jgi:hypothetical protein
MLPEPDAFLARENKTLHLPTHTHTHLVAHKMREEAGYIMVWPRRSQGFEEWALLLKCISRRVTSGTIYIDDIL